MGVNFKELQELQRRLEQAQSQVLALMQEIVDEISNEFLQEVIQRTPATNNNKLKKTGRKELLQIKMEHIQLKFIMI